MPRAQQGEAVWTGADGKQTRKASITCRHCGNLEFIGGENKGTYCGMCHDLICRVCAQRQNGRCTPFEKRLEALERRDRLRRAAGG